MESNDAVAIEMQHFTSRSAGTGGSNIEVIPNYGRTDSRKTLMPSTAGTQTVATGPKAVYSFFALIAASNAKVMVYLPPSFNVTPAAPLRYAFALDGATPTAVSPVPSATPGEMPSGWEDSFVRCSSDQHE